jgi:hypothetical protein
MDNLFIGHGADWWNTAMVITLCLAAFVALLVAAATAGVIVVQKREALAASNALARYKLEAGEKIAEARSIASKAVERAAGFEKDAEALKAANLKLEAVIAPRRLLPRQQAAITAALESFRGKKIRLVSYSLDTEGEVFAGQVRDALKPVLQIDDWVGDETAGNGFVKGISVTGKNEALVRALVDAFRAAGIEGIDTKPLPPPQFVAIVTEGSRQPAPDAEVEVIVGVKPLAE